jgi:hypothetical protein
MAVVCGGLSRSEKFALDAKIQEQFASEARRAKQTTSEFMASPAGKELDFWHKEYVSQHRIALYFWLDRTNSSAMGDWRDRQLVHRCCVSDVLASTGLPTMRRSVQS